MARIAYATASLIGCEIHTESADHSPRFLRYGSDNWASNNAAYERATPVGNVLPASVYFAELERSWSAERFNHIGKEVKDDNYYGTSWRTGFYDDGAPIYNGEIAENELPIAHYAPRLVYGFAGYERKNGSAYMDVCDRGISHVAPTPKNRKRWGKHIVKMLDRGTNATRKQHGCKLPAHLSRSVIRELAVKPSRFTERFID